MPKRIDALTPEQEARFEEWSDRWIEIGLRTTPADRERFETAAAECYRFAGVPWHGNVVWAPSPLVVALSGPIASHLLRRDAVDGAVRGAVRDAVSDAVRDAVSDAVSDAVRDAVDDAVSDAVDDAVRDAVSDAVIGAVDGAVGGAVRDAVSDAVRSHWYRVLGGQFWVGGWWYSSAFLSYFREVCDLELPGDLWDRARAYESTISSACWWWPHERFIVVSERPKVLSRELVDPKRPRGWRSHRLHRDDGPAVEWHGWGVYMWHGVRVPARVIDEPASLSVDDIASERNVEVRRVMLERFGFDRYVNEAGASKVGADEFGTLWTFELKGDPEPTVMVVQVTNSTPEPCAEPDCTGWEVCSHPREFKDYWLRVPPTMKTAHEAVAWTFGVEPDEYEPVAQT